MTAHPLDDALNGRGPSFAEVRGIRVATDFGDLAAEYQAAVSGAAIYDARERGLIELTGGDRAAWLNNLVTNTIKDLQPGEGNYTFATNVKGRVLLDFNMLVLADAIWLDIDRRLIDKAVGHFDRYVITEDVAIKDRSDAFARIALLGPRVAEIADALGVTQALAMASIGSTSVPLAGRHRLMVRHDFAGVLGLELYVEAADAAACWNRLLEIGRPIDLKPSGRSAVHVLRIEAGIPATGEDIDDEVLPAETRQIERAVSYVKGCYLGQEVVERMRSHGVLARQLVGVRLDGQQGVTPGAIIKSKDAEVGRLTSICHSRGLDAPIGLGYVKSASAKPGTKVTVVGEHPIEAEVVSLPFLQGEAAKP